MGDRWLPLSDIYQISGDIKYKIFFYFPLVRETNLAMKNIGCFLPLKKTLHFYVPFSLRVVEGRNKDGWILIWLLLWSPLPHFPRFPRIRKHMIEYKMVSKSEYWDVTWIFLMLFGAHMSTILIMATKIFKFIKWSYNFLQLCWLLSLEWLWYLKHYVLLVLVCRGLT